jgi:hypothetical protein
MFFGEFHKKCKQKKGAFNESSFLKLKMFIIERLFVCFLSDPKPQVPVDKFPILASCY